MARAHKAAARLAGHALRSALQGLGAPRALIQLVCALLLRGALAACPGGAAPGSHCVGAVETLCSPGTYCLGGTEPARACITPANCVATGLRAQPPCVWNVTTLAGSGSTAPVADGQRATFYGPSGVAADASGIVYVADFSNHRIRAVAPSGLVSTLAGSGTAAWADGTGTAASYNNPYGVATYPGSGTIYVADFNNNRIRMLTPSGVTTTVAGGATIAWADGQGTSARLHRPAGLAVDSAGTVFVADSGNHRIRKLSPLGAMTTLAGSASNTPFVNGVGSSSTFSNPRGVAVDPSGNVYVGDTNNNRIRHIRPDGTVTTLAGSGSITWADGTGTSAALARPQHLFLAVNGNLLVAEGNRIRMITPLGEVTTVAGDNTGSFADGYGTASLFADPIGVAVSTAGTVFIGDTGNNRIRALTCEPCPASYSCSALPSLPLLCPPGFYCPPSASSSPPIPCPPGTYSTAPGATSSATCQGCPLGSYCPPGAPQFFSCAAGYYGAAVNLSSPTCSGACSGAPGTGCAAGSVSPASTLCPAGNFCPGGTPAPSTPCMVPANCAVTGLSAEPFCVWNVTSLAGSGSSTPLSNGLGTAATFFSPSSVAADAAGVVYVADNSNNLIRAVAPSGLVITLAGSGTAAWVDGTGAAASFKSPSGVTVYRSSSIIYVADSFNHRIRRLTPAGATSTLAGSGVATWADGQGTFASFRSPSGLAVDSAGVVYVADSGNNRIRKITPQGTVTTLAGNGSSMPFANGVGISDATFRSPSGVAADGSGNVLVGDTQNNRIRLILPNGTVLTFAGSGSAAWADGTGSLAAFNSPRQLSLAANGNLLVADASNNRIRAISPLGVVTTLGGGVTSSFLDGFGTASLFKGPYGVAYSAGVLYVGDTISNRIRALTCVACPATYYCSTGIPLLCPMGSYCPTPSTTPTPCGPGTYNAQLGRTTSCPNCPANQYTPSTGQTTCDPCAAGQFSTPGSAICWPPGFYKTNTSSSPTQCPSGTYSNISAASQLSDCLSCPPGTSTGGALGATSCFSTSAGCPAGTFTASTTPLVCTACAAGTFSLATASACTPCQTGYYSGTGSATCALCPQGSYCPSGVETPCPKGTYGILPGSTGLFQACSSCPPGTFQPSLRATSIASCASCAAGSFSTSPASPNCTACAPGTANALVGQTSPDVCTPCASGTYTGLPGQASCTSTCPVGYIGTTAGGTSLSTACAACSPGTYSAFTGSLRCTACPPGQYAEQPGSTFCEDCPSGTFSNTPAATSILSCIPCAAGSYNPAPGQTSSGCIPCSPGTASSTAGASQASQCTPCSAGFYAALAGSVSCMLTPAGSFSGPSASSLLQCPLGMYSGAGVSACTPCPLGSAASTAGSASCTNCSAGHFSDSLGLSSCTPCPIGTFNNLPSSTSSAACQPCASGTFNPSLGQTSSGCISCPPGTASSASGASTLSQCRPCSAGTFASLAGSSNCTVSPAGSFSAPPPGGATGATSPTQCPLGTYSGIMGAVSSAQCTACPAGKTTASDGAMQDTQCLALPFSCPPGQQPRLASAASLADCTPLTCPAPLRPSAYVDFASDAQALPQSLSCLGCASGTLGSVPACSVCDSSSFCPGFTSRPLYNFSMDAASGAPRALAQGSGAPASSFSACPALASSGRSSVSSRLASSATSTIFFGVPLPSTSSQSLLAWVVIFSWLFFLAIMVAFSRATENASGLSALPLRALKAVDLFSMAHKVEDKSSPINEATPLGGLFSLMGLSTLLTYASYMVATWLQDNTLVQKSLATMGPSVWGELAALPWVAPTSSPLEGSIALRLTIDGNPGACAAPLSIVTSSLDSGAFVLKSTANCGDSGVVQHTLTCPSCRFTSDTSVSLIFDYSCQSMLLEALGSSPSYPGPLSLSIISAPTARTVAPKPGALLTSLTWQLSPVLSVLWDNVTAANSAIGWYLADSKLTLAPPLLPPAINGSLSILPTASPVTVTFALALSSTYSSTLLTQRVPITQLLANIVGLSGLLAIFGTAFGSFELYCARKSRAGGSKRTPLRSSNDGTEGENVEAAPQHEAEVFAVENILRQGSLTQRAGSTNALKHGLGAGAQRVVSAEGPAADVVWQRMSDSSGDVWFTSSAGDTAWVLPPGARLE
jgi:sugar lactone lactonase YvrE